MQRRTRLHSTPILALAACALTLVPFAAARPVHAQGTVRTDKPPPLFKEVVPQPTGQNGYEELVYASGLLQNCRAWKEFDARTGQTLEEKRVLLSDRTVVRVLALVKQGLSKPVATPRTQVDFTTKLPELATFRTIARLLVVQQYVQLADGRVPEALATMRTGMLLGRAVKTDTMISGLVGIAITAIAIRPLADHLDALSARECEAVHQLCVNWLQMPSALPAMLAAEQNGHKGTLRKIREAGAAALGQQFGAEEKDAPAEVKQAVAQFREQMARDPQFFDRFLADMERKTDSYFLQVAEELKKPLWQRKWPQPEPDGTLSGQMISLIAPALAQVENAAAREEAVVRLLACHAAVLRYRWEHNRLPTGLDQLRLGELSLDPFTGQPLEFKALGARRYRLGSVGPKVDGDTEDPRVVNGRRPVTISPDD